MSRRWRCKLCAIDAAALLAPVASVLVVAAAAHLGSPKGGVPPARLGDFALREAWMMLVPGLLLARTTHRHLYAARGLGLWARRQTRRAFLAEYVWVAILWAVAGAYVASQIPGFPRVPRPPAVILETYWFSLGSLFTFAATIWGLYSLLNWATKRPFRRLGSHVFCERCGYKLDGLTGERCPECGHELCSAAFKAPFGNNVFLR